MRATPPWRLISLPWLGGMRWLQASAWLRDIRHLLVGAAIGAMALAPTFADAGETELSSLVIAGHSRTLWSTRLQEQRRVIVSLPQHYGQSKRSYPVLFLLDGDEQFLHVAGTLQFLASTWIERMPEMILVAIANTDRSRDFLPATAKPEREGVHAADKFLAFIADELIPWTNANYRAAPYRVLAGHSDGGLFTSFVLANRPETFQAYFAMSPALNGDATVTAKLETTLRGLKQPPPLFLSWSGTDFGIRSATEALIARLQAKPVKGRWTHREYPQDTHASTIHRAIYDGLEWLFEGWSMSNPMDTGAFEPTVAQIDAHYADLSKRFGVTVTPPPSVMHRAAQALWKKKDVDGALAVWRRSATDYPYLPETHAQLARMLEQAGRIDEARQAYEWALSASSSAGSAYDDADRYREALRCLQP